MDIGSKEKFRCSLQNETNLIRWYNSAGQELNSGGRIKAFSDGTFAIQRVELSDGGTYQCRGLEYIQYYTIYVNGISQPTGPRRPNKTYLDLINMAEYDSSKYAKVEDLGSDDNKEQVTESKEKKSGTRRCASLRS
ncbi:hypothetical protein OS493_028488 [Desmophyllum pertusum]|uniref:Ig-like domain-containing protein n=1 Tax=Desmophyllum pertusum TaxID=174260 RepID=A0A9X0CVV7_9CNID|nr:hypothetical protein OS493_028488 [Desmophyllum pertusum]